MTNRRTVLGRLAAAMLIPLWWPGRSRATPERMADAIRDATGGAPVRPGRVVVELPAIAENGNSVPLTVRVDSPMTGAEHVQSIHVFAEKNPLPTVARFDLGPRSGRAQVATRIRLADSQRVVVLAQLSDGSFWSGSAEIVVTIAACGG